MLVGPGEASFAMAEQFAFDQVFRQRTAIDGHHRLGGAMALSVQRAGDQFLAGAGFAEDQHAGIRRRDFGDPLANALHGRRFADQVARPLGPFEAALQGAEFLRHLALLADARQQRFQRRQFAGLGEIVERPLPQRRHGRVERRFAGEHDGIDVGRKLFGPRDDLNAVEARHVEIDQQAIERMAFERGDGGRAVGADGHFVSHPGQLDAHQLLQRRLVVGEQQLQAFTRLGSDGEFSLCESACWIRRAAT